MLITRTSPFSGKENTREIDVDKAALEAYTLGLSGSIQRAFPHLSADDREFIMTGITPEEWPKETTEDDY